MKGLIMHDYMYVKLTKEWGGFNIGDVVRFGWSKGESRVREGFGVKVPKQKAVNEKEKPKIETANIEPVKKPDVETADITPVVTKKIKKDDEKSIK